MTTNNHAQSYSTETIIEIRLTAPADYPAIVRMGEAAGMGTLDGFDDALVATSAVEDIIAFCRLKIYDGIAHVNPIVVDASLRNHGMGATLMKAARRYAIGFYKFIGCAPIDWEEAAPKVASDCNRCDERESCHPLPMKYLAE